MHPHNSFTSRHQCKIGNQLTSSQLRVVGLLEDRNSTIGLCEFEVFLNDANHANKVLQYVVWTHTNTCLPRKNIAKEVQFPNVLE